MLVLNKGIRVNKRKELTKDKPIEESKPPKFLYFPVGMHVGEAAQIVVKKGDKVNIGSVLAEASDGISANIHSSVSGTVVDIRKMDSFKGETDLVIVENDYEDREDFMEDKQDFSKIEDLVERISQAGVVGKGGAGFPTHIKYQEDKDNIKYLLVNGAECEPYSTTDYRVMVEFGDQIVEAMDMVNKIYETEKSYIAVEKHMQDAIDKLKQAIRDKRLENIEVYELGNNYPQGHSGLQIKEVLGIEIEEGERSGDVGVLQSNVSTYKAIYDACFKNKFYTSRVITVTGPKIKNPKNLLVRVGTPVSHLIEECGGLTDEDVIFINGGPMMGKQFENTDYPVEKDTTTILCMDKRIKEEESTCIRCSRCINVCPVSLNPIAISEAYRHMEYYKAVLLKTNACISCGSCSYVCPANINLLDDIQKINQKWEELNG
ncbi:MAG: electron transport complex subunit RsxC [Finegoldia sp.]|nr:electron transport complex subunit RsxC [Finegoldia sp.]